MHFSVVIPTYNVERYLPECVASAVAQQFGGDHEVIVVDDGSTDGTAQLIHELARQHACIRPFFQANDGAPGKARNRGIDAARGEFLVFLDSDDRLAPGALAFFQRAFAEHHVDVVAGARQWIDERSRVTGTRTLPPPCLGRRPLDGRFALQLRQLYVNASAKAFRRSVVQQAGLRFPEGHPGQDTAFAIAFFAHACASFAANHQVYDVRLRSDAGNPSLTQQFDTAVVRRRLLSARQCVTALHAGGMHAYAADTHAYFLLGMLSRLVQEQRRGRLHDLAGARDALLDYCRDGRALAPPRLMSGALRRRWRLADLLLRHRWLLRGALTLARLRPGA